MMAIDDQARRQAIFGQLVPNVIGMPANRRMSAVAQMRAHSGAGIDRCFNLVAGRLGMANRDQHAAGYNFFDDRR